MPAGVHVSRSSTPQGYAPTVSSCYGQAPTGAAERPCRVAHCTLRSRHHSPKAEVMYRPCAIRLLSASAVLLFALTPTRPLHAQSQATTGLIRGTVSSASGAPVQGATVVLKN